LVDLSPNASRLVLTRSAFFGLEKGAAYAGLFQSYRKFRFAK